MWRQSHCLYEPRKYVEGKALVSRLISVDLDVPPAGLEPAPHSLRVYCSTN